MFLLPQLVDVSSRSSTHLKTRKKFSKLQTSLCASKFSSAAAAIWIICLIRNFMWGLWSVLIFFNISFRERERLKTIDSDCVELKAIDATSPRGCCLKLKLRKLLLTKHKTSMRSVTSVTSFDNIRSSLIGDCWSLTWCRSLSIRACRGCSRSQCSTTTTRL